MKMNSGYLVHQVRNRGKGACDLRRVLQRPQPRGIDVRGPTIPIVGAVVPLRACSSGRITRGPPQPGTPDSFSAPQA